MFSNPFWKSARALLEYRLQLAVGAVGLLISAGCFGAGLGMLLPTFYLLLQQKQNVAEVITKNLAGPDAAPWRQHLAQVVTDFFPVDPFQAFVRVLLCIAVLSAIGSLARYLHEYIAITVSSRAAMSWRKRMFRRLIRAPMPLLVHKGSSDHITRMMVDTSILNGGYQIVTGRALQDLSKGMIALGVALYFDWQLSAIALVIGPILAVLLRKFGKRIRRATSQALTQQTRLLAAMREAITGVSVVKVHNAEGYERRRFNRINRDLYRQEMKARTVKAMSSPLIETLAQYAVMVVATIAAWWILGPDKKDPAKFMTVLASLGAAGASMRPLTNVFSQLKEAEAAAARVLEVLELPTEHGTVAPGDLRPLPRHNREILFDHVSFTYPGDRAQTAVNEVTLKVAFGQTVAIVGGNGAGKSTLLNLLPRLLEPTTGKVLIDGMDTRTVTLRSLRQQIAVVTQQTILFEGTIAQNIAYGRRHESMDRIIAAGKAAYADDFVRTLPQQYETVLGEDGSGLSGGQRQRLCIARAILRNPAVLILDEATSQIDADSEAKINQALRELRYGRTTFIIAHRLSTVVDADLIVVMDQGKIIAQGTHTELLQRCAIYQVLVQTQLLPGASA